MEVEPRGRVVRGDVCPINQAEAGEESCEHAEVIEQVV